MLNQNLTEDEIEKKRKVVCFIRERITNEFSKLIRINIYSHHTSIGSVFDEKVDRTIKNLLKKTSIWKGNANCMCNCK